MIKVNEVYSGKNIQIAKKEICCFIRFGRRRRCIMFYGTSHKNNCWCFSHTIVELSITYFWYYDVGAIFKFSTAALVLTGAATRLSLPEYFSRPCTWRSSACVSIRALVWSCVFVLSLFCAFHVSTDPQYVRCNPGQTENILTTMTSSNSMSNELMACYWLYKRYWDIDITADYCRFSVALKIKTVGKILSHI